jgi:hypothetical protein
MKHGMGLVAAALASTFLLSGCLSARSFVDPAYGNTTYNDLKKRSEPLRVRLAVEFQQNGKPLPAVDATLRASVEKTLAKSGLIVPVTDASAGELKIVLNNVGDLDAARAKGLNSGLTFGAAGTTVTDFYEMQMSLSTGGKVVTKNGKHALHTAIGNTETPKGIETMPVNLAFERVVEQLLLNAMAELQRSGELSSVRPSMWETIRRLVLDA